MADYYCGDCGERTSMVGHACPAHALPIEDDILTSTFAPLEDLCGEIDPTGRDPKEGGAKLDSGKAPVVQGLLHYFPRACRAVANLSQKGAAKSAWNGWETVPDGVNRYANAGGRHILDEAEKGLWDDAPGGTGELHKTCVAWNMLAALELQLREMEIDG